MAQLHPVAGQEHLNAMHEGNMGDSATDVLQSCIICSQVFPREEGQNLIVNSCPKQHVWCQDCTIYALSMAAESEAYFPIKCCWEGHFNIDLGAHLLDEETGRKLDLVRELHETSDRTFCSNIPCNAFLPPRFFNENIATCTNCLTSTCCLCKQDLDRHTNGECPQPDNATLEMEKLAQENLWQLCPFCKIWVEHTSGCYHMTCLVGHEFCLLCGAPWKTCDCLTDEDDIELMEDLDDIEQPEVQENLPGVPADTPDETDSDEDSEQADLLEFFYPISEARQCEGPCTRYRTEGLNRCADCDLVYCDSCLREVFGGDGQQPATSQHTMQGHRTHIEGGDDEDDEIDDHNEVEEADVGDESDDSYDSMMDYDYYATEDGEDDE